MSKTMTRRVLAGLALTILAQTMTTGPVMARETVGRPILSCLDRDGDGIEREDIAAFRAWRFERLDRDGDGAITVDEFTARAENSPPGRERFLRRAALWAWLRSGCAFGGGR
jgi:hypothetical protein